MLTTAMSSVTKKEKLTVEEYQRLKRRLFGLRSRYARLLCSIRDQGETPEKRREATRLEQRISALEGRLARADIDFPDEEPLTIVELGYYTALFFQQMRGWLSAQLVQLQEVVMTKIKQAKLQKPSQGLATDNDNTNFRTIKMA